jgi:hypothetical protein
MLAGLSLDAPQTAEITKAWVDLDAARGRRSKGSDAIRLRP